MFKNIGKKIKILAKVVCWIGIIASVIMGLIIMFDAYSLVGGLFAAAVGALSSWIGSFLLYGFGELVDNTSEIAKKLDMKNESLTQEAPKSDFLPKYDPAAKYKCPECGEVFSHGAKNCPGCNKSINWK